jgi:hypothetical protein
MNVQEEVFEGNNRQGAQRSRVIGDEPDGKYIISMFEIE